MKKFLFVVSVLAASCGNVTAPALTEQDSTCEDSVLLADTVEVVDTMAVDTLL